MKRSLLVAGAFFVVSLALRAPFRSRYAYHWDSAQFALAMEHFDLRIGQPHVPGHFLYVMLGRLVNLLVGEPHASLVWISIVAGAALAALGFLLASAMYGRACGMATGVILATSPLCWFHSEVALTTILDSTLVVATMLVGWHAMRRGGRWGDVVVLAALLAWVAGNRPQTAVGLLPAWLFVFWQFTKRPVKLAVGLSLAGLFCLLWLVPMVHTPCGWGEYFQLIAWKFDFDAPRSGWHGGALTSLGVIVRSCWAGLLAAVVLAGIAWRRRLRGEGRLLLWWIGPMVALGVLTYTAMPGHVLSYFPALAIVAGRACTRWFSIVIIALVNFVVFLSGASLSAREIRQHDRQLADACAVIQTRYRPGDVLLCHREEFFLWGIRHFQYHLPAYSNVLLGRDPSLPAERAGRYRVCRGAQTEFVDDWKQAADGRMLLLVVPPGEPAAIFADRVDLTRAVAVPGASGIFELPQSESF